MSDVLDRILLEKRRELEVSKPCLAEFKARSKDAPAVRDFVAALKARDVAIIAEVKRKSPSRGEIRPGADPVDIAMEYQANGAAAISVLTDYPFFGGSIADLEAVRAKVELPVLRKDFIMHEVQLYEARAFGADAVLLMASVLDDARLADLHGLATELGMAALVEVHDTIEAQRVRKLNPALVGINNRNLKTLEVDIKNSLGIMTAFNRDTCLVSESGIKSAADIAMLQRAGISSFLVGSSLMSAPEPGQALAALLEVR